MNTTAVALFLLTSCCFVSSYVPLSPLLPISGFNKLRQHLTTSQIEELVQERAELRETKDYEKADAIKALLESNLIIVTDYPFVSWRRVDAEDVDEDEEHKNVTLLDMAKIAIEHSTTCYQEAETRYGKDVQIDLQDIVRMAKQKLRSVMRRDASEMLSPVELKIAKKASGLEYTGRYMVDCALKFAFAGIKDEELFDLLDTCIYSELKRFGGRSSCRAIDVLQIVEKLAVSGQRNSRCYPLAAEILIKKSNYHGNVKDTDTTVEQLKYQDFCLLNDRPLLWLFRNSAKQIKTYKHEKMAPGSNISDISTLFEDPTLPLYIDLGCGYGVSNLALSSNFSACNILGCDLSQSAVNYAESISSRWRMDGRCRFVNYDAETCLRAVLSSKYSGAVEAITVNFPSPYRQSAMSLDKVFVDKGNSQLPSTLEDFLLTNTVVELSKQVMQRKKQGISPSSSSSSSSSSSQKPFLFMQSNVEDVAITMKEILEASGIFGISKSLENANEDWTFLCDSEDEILKNSPRQQRWRRNREVERAYGIGWLKKSPFDGISKSETEVNCNYHGKPIFRRQLFIL